MNLFQPVKSGKVSERIVRQIKDTILSGKMKPGDRLPPERELVEWFQVSRISIREALKSLETSGLLTIRPGSGVFIAQVNSKPMSDSLSSLLRIQKVSVNEVTEARIIFEPSIARLASERMTPEDFRKLDLNIKETSAMLQSNRSARAKNIEFHSLIAESTHNSVLTLTMKTLLDVLQEMSSEIVDHSPKNLLISRSAIDYHRKILKAFQEKKSQRVYDLMLKHILQIQLGLEGTKSLPDERNRSMSQKS
jgi:GntR family transcriptional regulator, transcriptional repressor for pyruvate dehydrogenase complex